MEMATAARRRDYRMVARAQAQAATSERILDSTDRLFFDSASDRFSLEDVAAGAGTTVQTVLRHFSSKKLLLRACMDRAMESVRRERAETVIGDVADAVRNVVRHYEERGDLVLRWLAEEGRNPFLREVVERGRELHREWVATAFAPQLSSMSGARRQSRLAQLVALTDVYMWKLLRRDMRLSRARTRAAIVQMIEGLERT
jgi:AcrR family transcriptional regulator